MPDILVIAPWLQGGGGQSALVGLLKQLPKHRVRLVILFRGNRNIEPVLEHVADHVSLEEARSVAGIARARKALKPHLRRARSVYSLMRASHLVLGAGALRDLNGKRFAATFHQLPSEDSTSLIGRIEDVVVRRAVRKAGLVTAPSPRAIAELADLRFAQEARLRYEPNVVAATSTDAVAPRIEDLTEVKLLFAGRLSEQKGLDRLPQILRMTSVPVHIRVVGDGELADLAHEIADTTLSPHRVEVLGHSNDVASHLDWADALLLPSYWELNPMIIWEAWARGRPVLSSNLPVFQDLTRVGPIWPRSNDAEIASALSTQLIKSDARNRAFADGMNAFAQHSTERRYLADFLTG